MSDDSHLTEAPGHPDAVAHHATDDHGDEHGHAEEPLGPIDVPAWGAGVIGILLGLAVVVAFILATAPV